MRKLLYILILFVFSCKSTKTNTNNQLDVTEIKTESIENNIRVTQLDTDEFELTFHTADPKQPVIFTDKNGKKTKLENVKSATLKKKTEQKKDSTVKENNTVAEKKIDKSKINEEAETISDANNFKSIFKNIALIVVCFLIVFLIIRFRIKSKTNNEINL